MSCFIVRLQSNTALFHPKIIPPAICYYLYPYSVSPRFHAKMKNNIRQFCTVHADGNDDVIKFCEVRELNSRAPLAGNDGLTQPLFQTPTHKGRR